MMYPSVKPPRPQEKKGLRSNNLSSFKTCLLSIQRGQCLKNGQITRLENWVQQTISKQHYMQRLCQTSFLKSFWVINEGVFTLLSKIRKVLVQKTQSIQWKMTRSQYTKTQRHQLILTFVLGEIELYIYYALQRIYHK